MRLFLLLELAIRNRTVGLSSNLLVKLVRGETIMRASNGVDDPAARQALGDRALQVLQHMADQQMNIHPQTVGEFRTGKSFTTLRQRDDFNAVVDQLDQLNKELGLPLYIRQMPEPLKTWAKWFAD